MVDIFCYRKYGHNEGDDPSFTHPLMYRIIEGKKSPPTIYAERCRAAGIFPQEREEAMRTDFRTHLKKALQASRAPAVAAGAPEKERNAWNWNERIPAPPEDRLRLIARALTAAPAGFHMHPKLKRIVEEKAARLERDGTVDWAFAESLAFGSLLLQGTPLRLSGQDSARGTFSQRHLVWWDSETLLPQPYLPLSNLAPDQAQFSVYDSPLSEYSVLGFEYGFAQGRPKTLVMWEAQFGDFSNGGQVIIDNYVAAGEAKWGTTNGIALLLPHGFEGQGPEHSSGHMERFLMLCARDNIQVCNCSTPAQYFHLLRRQARSCVHKPLIVMTPKSLLRNPRAVSQFRELSEGAFQEMLPDPAAPRAPQRLVFCAGKIFYDLAAARDKQKDAVTEIVRIEQLYPFPEAKIAALLERHAGLIEATWVQEEPRNRGAWLFVKDHFQRSFPALALHYVGREESASPATGSHARHEREQAEIVDAALSADRVAAVGK